MNRGKTALKRGVAVASAAAIAIAGAVLAAPAASAWNATAAPGLGDMVRATPAADDAAGYSVGTTGEAPSLTVGANGQAASGLQFQLPIEQGTTQDATWLAGESLVVTLPSGVTFSSAPTAASSPLSDLTTLAKQVNPTQIYTDQDKNSTGTSEKLVTPQPTVALGTGSQSAVITFPKNQWGSGDVTQNSQTFSAAPKYFSDSAMTTAVAPASVGYVVSLSGVKLNVASTFTGIGITAKVTGTTFSGGFVNGTTPVFNADNTVGGSTTIGWVPPIGISVASGNLVYQGGLQALPAITITEVAKDAFVSGSSYVITAPAGAQFDTTNSSPTYTTSSAALTATGALTAGTLTVTLGGTASATALDSVVIKGLVVSNVTTSNDLSFTLAPATAPPSYTAVNLKADGTTASTFAFSADLSAAPSNSLTVSGAQLGNRIAGTDRYQTAALIAAQPAFGGVDAVVIANGENYKQGFDALAANYFAGQVQAPILLTQANVLAASTANAVSNLAKNSGATTFTIYVFGSTDSVSAAVATQLAALNTGSVNLSVVRVAGSNRYATAAKAATWNSTWSVDMSSFTYLQPRLRTAFLVSGLVNADALAAGPLSFRENIPVLLTGSGSTVPAETAAAITNLGIQQVIVLGGTDRVSAAAVTSLSSLGVLNVKRIAGSDRFATAADLAALAVAPAANSTTTSGGFAYGPAAPVYLANGLTGFPDALAVGPLAGENSGLLYTVPPTSLPGSVSAALTAASPHLGGEPTALGQPSTVAQSLVNAVWQLLN